jgi:arsenate reductase
MKKLNILFLCTGNSCRSQMAETHGLNPNAVKVMAEVGVDISNQTSKNVNTLLDVPFDYVVTVCGHANENCPFFPGDAKVVHVGFQDPPAMAKLVEGEEEKLDCYRRVRDEIRKFVEKLPEGLRIFTAKNA